MTPLWIIAGGDPAVARTAADCLEQSLAYTVIPCPGPLEREDDVARAFDAAERQDGTVAGVVVLVPADEPGLLAEMEIEAWEATFAARLRHAFLIAQRAVDGFLAAGAPGTLVFVLGWPADQAVANEVLESALYSFARSISKEYGRRGVTCNLIVACGGAMPREARVSAALDLLRFAASPDASFVNGETLRVP